MTIMFHGFTIDGFLGVLVLLVASSAIASEDFTCISLQAKSIKRYERKDVTRRRCRTLCESGPSCAGYHFAQKTEKARCTLTYINDESKDSKSCMRSTKIREGLSDKRYACNNGRTATLINISEANCDDYCEGKGKCDSYIYDSNKRRCITIPMNTQNRTKILRQGKRNKLCQVVSKFQEAYYENVSDDLCPCYNEDDLTPVVRMIKGGQAVMDQEVSCKTDAASNTIELKYSNNSDTLVFGSYDGNCTGEGTYSVTNEHQDDQCKSLIYDACDTLPARQEKCPCFDKEDLDKAVTKISGDEFEMDYGSCSTDPNSYGIELTYTPKNSNYRNRLGFGVYTDSCSKADVKQRLEDDNEIKYCQSLIENVCDTLPARQEKCRCFDKEDLDTAVINISGDEFEMFDGSCSTDPNRYGIVELTYYAKNSNYRNILGFSAYPDGCSRGDAIRILENDNEINDCRSLIENVCDTLPARQEKCPCFNEIELESAVTKINGDELKMDNGSCSTDPNRYGIELTYTPMNFNGHHRLGFGAYPDSCMKGGDMYFDVKNEKEMKQCQALMYNACMLLNLPLLPDV